MIIATASEFNSKNRYAENSSATTRRMQLVEIEGRKSRRKLTRRKLIECKQTRRVIADYPHGLFSANKRLIFVN